MSDGHRFILVEDDADTAQALVELFDMHGWKLDVAGTLEEFRELMASGREYCAGLHDLDLPLTRKSIKPHSDAGLMSIQEQRAAAPMANELGVHYTPILCVSQPAKDHRIGRRARRAGADDIVVKPFIENDESLVDTVRRFMRDCGREDHAMCAEITGLARRRPSARPSAQPPAAATTCNRLAVTGTAVKRGRIEITCNGRTTSMTDKGLIPLLWLYEGRLRGQPAVAREGLGPGAEDPNYRGLAVMQEQLAPYLQPSTRLYKRVGKGEFALDDGVVFENVDAAALLQHYDHQIRRVASAIAAAQGVKVAPDAAADLSAPGRQGRRKRP